MKAQKYTRETISALGVSQRKFSAFDIGDHINVAVRIKETKTEKGKSVVKERIQHFEGDVIAMHKNGASSTFTVRKIASNSIPVERIFPLYSPIIDSIKFVRKGKVRRAKLYYMRDRIGKAARVKEKLLTREQKEQRAAAQAKAVAAQKAEQASQAPEAAAEKASE